MLDNLLSYYFQLDVIGISEIVYITNIYGIDKSNSYGALNLKANEGMQIDESHIRLVPPYKGNGWIIGIKIKIMYENTIHKFTQTVTNRKILSWNCPNPILSCDVSNHVEFSRTSRLPILHLHNTYCTKKSYTVYAQILFTTEYYNIYRGIYKSRLVDYRVYLGPACLFLIPKNLNLWTYSN